MQTRIQPLHLIVRISAALLGGYLLTFGAAALGVAGLVALGLRYDQASTATMMVALLVFLAAFLWAFAAASIVRVWLVLACGGVLTTMLAWWLQRLVVE